MHGCACERVCAHVLVCARVNVRFCVCTTQKLATPPVIEPIELDRQRTQQEYVSYVEFISNILLKLQSSNFTIDYVQYIQYTVQCILYSEQCTLYTV